MNEEQKDAKRVTAFSYVSGGIGHATVEGELLVDWGTFRVIGTGAESNVNRIIEKSQKLLSYLRPHTIIIQDLDDPEVKKGLTARMFAAGMLNVLQGCHATVQPFPHKRILTQFPSKQALAEHIAEKYPELKPHLPARKIWQSEDRRMAIFEAMAMVMAI